ncbi:MAG TPA: cytochrome c biogenesis protein ResB [Bdellovibrionota bacterium]|jgi:hypothetical protein|nr:cytochrome c biogenesis protein ResB [Bdellovibrionota bacterium]
MILWRIFKSLQLAVLVIVSLAGSLATGTFLESYYDTPTARYYVYDSVWFGALLALLATNITVVALSRIPWKKHHLPFLLAHLGILLMIVGSGVTRRFGMDGTMPVGEDETANSIEFDQTVLYLAEGEHMDRVVIPWVPPQVKAPVLPIPAYSLVVDQYLTHAQPSVRFKPSQDPKSPPAVRILLSGGPMQLHQDLWLWSGDPAWASVDLGPAQFSLLKGSPPAGRPSKPKATPAPSSVKMPKGMPPMGKAKFTLYAPGDGSLRYQAESMRGEFSQGRLGGQNLEGQEIDPGWKGLKVKVLAWVPHAENDTAYEPARVQYGGDAPGSAIHVSVDGGGPGMWLGMGDRATLALGGREVLMGYAARKVQLPFGIYLKEFKIGHYEGTNNPSSYSSTVQLAEEKGLGQPEEIYMNHPLHHGGYTFYQASYIPADPRPTVSVLSVNRDPGRPLKYGGAIFLVSGCILLFEQRIRLRKGSRT